MLWSKPRPQATVSLKVRKARRGSVYTYSTAKLGYGHTHIYIYIYIYIYIHIRMHMYLAPCVLSMVIIPRPPRM